MNASLSQGIATTPQPNKSMARVLASASATRMYSNTHFTYIYHFSAPMIGCATTTQSVAPQMMSGSTSAIAGTSNSNQEVLQAFECPVCLEYMMPPYLQCQSGHLVCGNCRPKLQCCPTCRGPVRKYLLGLSSIEPYVYSKRS
jgi:E3 ubiquitin-protein ligase SIAH1